VLEWTMAKWTVKELVVEYELVLEEEGLLRWARE
jgi:hypothetical protein